MGKGTVLSSLTGAVAESGSAGDKTCDGFSTSGLRSFKYLIEARVQGLPQFASTKEHLFQETLEPQQSPRMQCEFISLLWMYVLKYGMNSFVVEVSPTLQSNLRLSLGEMFTTRILAP